MPLYRGSALSESFQRVFNASVNAAWLRVLLSAVFGIGFFAFPVSFQGRTTVLFDVLVKRVIEAAPRGVALYCFALIAFGAGSTLASRLRNGSASRATGRSNTWVVLRLVGLVLAVAMLFRVGPDFLLAPKIANLMWNTLVFSVGVIIPIGAVFLNLFVSYGCLEFVGVFMRPLMRPLFRLPGRSALDDLTSWLGSYSVGLYLTRKLFLQGYYTRRETYTIVTCFSTVSIGFVGVVAATLDLLQLFPVIFVTYFFVIYLLTFLLVRMWPIRSVPDTYWQEGRPEPELRLSVRELGPAAWQAALTRARSAPGFTVTIREGFLEGLKLTTSILGTILAVGTLALVLAEYTPIFRFLSAPLAPVLRGLGLPDAEMIAPATLAGIAEMYIPALLVKDAATPARFFIAVLSISQLIFFSSVGPMILDMFQEIPVRLGELVALFFLRTALLIPILAGVTHLLVLAGMV